MEQETNSDTSLPEIPEQIRDVMREEEIENIRNLDGWAFGPVGCRDGGHTKEVIADAWIELFNGDGRAGTFGGVRFMAVDQTGEYREAYAYGSEAALEQNTDTGWFVIEYEYIDGHVGAKAPGGV